MTHFAEKDAGLWAPDPEASDNGRPLASHDRRLTDDHARELHVGHVTRMNALCLECGCCWCCDENCCGEYRCTNRECGCSMREEVDWSDLLEAVTTRIIPPAKTGSDDD